MNKDIKSTNWLSLNFKITCYFFFIFLFACSEKSEAWSNFGTYHGSIGDIAETIVLDENGAFTHSVFKSEKMIFTEVGKYSIHDESVSFSKFTAFYDVITQQLLDKGDRSVGHSLILFSGLSYSKLQPAPPQEYALWKRTNSKSRETNP